MANRSEFNFDDEEFSFDEEFLEEEPSGRRGAARDIEEEFPELEDEEEERPRTNTTFIALAAVMIILFVAGLAAVLFLATRQEPVSPLQLSATAIVMLNMTVEAQLNQTQTQAAIFAQQTQTAQAASPTPSPSPTNTREATHTPTPTLDATDMAGTQIALQMTADAEGTRIAQANISPTVPPTEGLGPEQIAQTATALAGLFQTATAQAAGAVGTPGVTPFAPLPTALPETGLFDDVGVGNRDSFAMLAVAALGLVGVIVVSRRLRMANGK